MTPDANNPRVTIAAFAGWKAGRPVGGMSNITPRRAPAPRRRRTSPRHRIQPGDIPAAAAAARMGMTLEAFTMALPNLVARGFPKADPDTGNFDLDGIDAWRKLRHPHLFGGVAEFGARDASTVVKDRIAAASRVGRSPAP